MPMMVVSCLKGSNGICPPKSVESESALNISSIGLSEYSSSSGGSQIERFVGLL